MQGTGNKLENQTLRNMKKITEDYIQNQCWIWFVNLTHKMKPRPVIYSVPNDEASPVQAKRKNLTGRKAGVSDLVVMLPNGKSLYIEMKTLEGRQSESQKRFEKECEELGFDYYLCRSVEEFKQVIWQNIPTLSHQ